MSHRRETSWHLTAALLGALLAGCQSTSSSTSAGGIPKARVQSRQQASLAAARKAAERADAQFAAVEKLSAAAGPRPAPLPGYPTLNAGELRRQQAIACRSAAHHYGRLAALNAELATTATDPAEKAARLKQSRELTAAARALLAASQE